MNGWSTAHVRSFCPNWVQKINTLAKDWRGCNNIRCHRCWPSLACCPTNNSTFCKFIQPSRRHWKRIHRFIASKIAKRAAHTCPKFEFVSASNWNWSIVTVWCNRSKRTRSPIVLPTHKSTIPVCYPHICWIASRPKHRHSIGDRHSSTFTS